MQTKPDAGRWWLTLGLCGRNATDEGYGIAGVNAGDDVLSMLSNDASEFGWCFQ